MQLSVNTNIRINLYRLVPLAIILWPVGNAIADMALSPLRGGRSPAVDMSAPIYLSQGDEVAGHEVSSTYDMHRPHPVTGIETPHYGVDVATPTGTKLLAPTVVEVQCWFDPEGGGEVANVTPDEGVPMKMLHLSTCVPGRYKQGQSFALTGDSGLGTGEHLDARRMDKTEPSLQDIEPYLTGKLPARQNSKISDRELTCSIGAAEGTRDENCEPTAAYRGHTDPGNGADNLGSFSYQHGADSPADADRRQLARLRHAETDLQQRSQEKWGKPLSKPAIGAALDLWNQAPLAGESFVDELPSSNPTREQIVNARSRSYIDPTTGKLDAPGLGNDPAKVEADQQRRTDEVENQLQQRRLDQLGK